MVFSKTCHTCKIPFTFESDSGCPDSWAGKLSVLVVNCQRCSNFGWNRMRLREEIERIALNAAMGKKQKEASKESVTLVFRSFCSLMHKHYRADIGYDDEFAVMLLDHPTKICGLLWQFEEGVRQIAENQKFQNAIP